MLHNSHKAHRDALVISIYFLGFLMVPPTQTRVLKNTTYITQIEFHLPFLMHFFFMVLTFAQASALQNRRSPISLHISVDLSNYLCTTIHPVEKTSSCGGSVSTAALKQRDQRRRGRGRRLHRPGCDSPVKTIVVVEGLGCRIWY